MLPSHSLPITTIEQTSGCLSGDAYRLSGTLVGGRKGALSATRWSDTLSDAAVGGYGISGCKLTDVAGVWVSRILGVAYTGWFSRNQYSPPPPSRAIILCSTKPRRKVAVSSE